MDWIERLFGMAPDDGDGTIELLIMLVVAALVVAGIVWRVPGARAAVQRFFVRPAMPLRSRRKR